MDVGENGRLYENCVNSENEDPLDVVRTQIDMSLDLLIVARELDDTLWQEQLMKRLKVLSERKTRLKERKNKIR